MAAMGVSIALVGVLLTALNLGAMSRLIDAAENRALVAHFDAIASAVADESRTAEALSVLVANLPPAREGLARGDRQALRRLFEPAFKGLQPFGIEQFQF